MAGNGVGVSDGGRGGQHPEHGDAAQANEVLGELDTFLANVALGLNR